MGLKGEDINNSTMDKELMDKATEWGKEGNTLWIKIAKDMYNTKRKQIRMFKNNLIKKFPSNRSWIDAFIEALNSEEMKPYIKEKGIEETRWKETSISEIDKL